MYGDETWKLYVIENDQVISVADATIAIPMIDIADSPSHLIWKVGVKCRRHSARFVLHRFSQRAMVMDREVTFRLVPSLVDPTLSPSSGGLVTLYG
ncbi:MAG: hypothetical protein R3C05_08575 [Pirellulaceae bacterium]